MEPKGYSLTQISLHWLVALLILAQFLFSGPMNWAWSQLGKGNTPAIGLSVWGHIIAGMLVLAFAVWRLSLRFGRGVPGPAAGETPLQAMIAAAVHWGLYLVMLGMPVSGLIAWFGGVRAAGEAHQLIKMGLLVLVGLHVLGALYNQFVLKNRLIGRMMKADG